MRGDTSFEYSVQHSESLTSAWNEQRYERELRTYSLARSVQFEPSGIGPCETGDCFNPSNSNLFTQAASTVSEDSHEAVGRKLVQTIDR